MCSNVDEGISKAGNSHRTKSTYVSPCVGLCVGLEPERPTPRQCGAMSTKQANCVKMGKDRMKGEKLTGVSPAGGNKADLAGGWDGSFMGLVGERPAASRLGVGERPLNDSTHTTHRACGQHRCVVSMW